MQKSFNDTGLCNPKRHYMVDTSPKLEHVIQLVEKGSYFTINGPRQYGKTTTLLLLTKALNQRADYLALRTSFEGAGEGVFDDEHKVGSAILGLLAQRVQFTMPDVAERLTQGAQEVTTIATLSQFITTYIASTGKKVVLLIDEVDKSSNHPLFLRFLGMLRDKYLNRDEGEATFHAVILAGVHDIKTLKYKARPGDTGSYNSPWNIAIDFEVDLSFSASEIETMLVDYAQENGVELDVPTFAERLYYYTSGYPYLVSKLCKFIDEKVIPARADKSWSVDDVETAFKMIVNDAYTTTLFDSLIKHFESYDELYRFVFRVVINGEDIRFIIADPVINLAHLYGILRPSPDGYCRVHNRIFEQRIYAYMLSKFMRTEAGQLNGFGGPEFYTVKGLDLKRVLQRFQTFMQEHYSDRDEGFLEREGRLLFLAYLQPILNGRGFAFKEPVTGDERRMDIVITHQTQRYVLELKRWYGERYHKKGLQQLSDYLDHYSLKTGYLLIYDFSKGKTYRQEQIQFQDKSIFAVWV